jgi:TatD DNase family protein
MGDVWLDLRAARTGVGSMPPVIDSHCHIDRIEEFKSSLEGLAAAVTVGTDAARAETAVRLADGNERVFAAVGLHPTDAERLNVAGETEALEALLSHPKVVAVGETGFDTHWDDTQLEIQRQAFDWHADAAARHGLPLVLHVRDRQGREDASLASVDALTAHPNVRGVLHCCNGHERLVRTALDFGWMVSFAGNVTYKTSDGLRATAAWIPEDRLMVETDAPFLSPVPYRGKPNTPSRVRLTLAVVAEARGVDAAALEATTDQNAVRFYGLPQSLLERP